MPNPKEIAIADYAYHLPDDRIARYPQQNRDDAKLLVLEKSILSETTFAQIGESLPPSALLLLNETKVIQARLLFCKETGSHIEIFCLEPLGSIETAFAARGEGFWKCFIGNNKKWKSGDLHLANQTIAQQTDLSATRVAQDNDAWIVHFRWNSAFSFSQILEMAGETPLPPYLNRKAESEDKQNYQTVFARAEGSVAAPTAGLHFSNERLEKLEKQYAVSFAKLTLHVGVGTFKPISGTTLAEHQMHTERVVVPKATIQLLRKHLETAIIPVGTTSVRTIESLYWHAVKRKLWGETYGKEIDILQWDPYEKTHQDVFSPKEALDFLLAEMESDSADFLYGQTQLMIAPPYKYAFPTAIITNFHQPQSSLLLLVSAFIGDAWKEAYEYAIQHNFRFLSYGDGCLFHRP